MKRIVLFIAALAVTLFANAQQVTATELISKMSCATRSCIQTFAESHGFYFNYEQPADVEGEVVVKYWTKQRETAGGVLTPYSKSLNVQLSSTGVSVITVITGILAEHTKLVDSFKTVGFYATKENIVDGIYTLSYYASYKYPAYQVATNKYTVVDEGITYYRYMVVINLL